MKEKESVIENYVVQHAKKFGYISRKMNGFGFNSWPDRVFIGLHKEAQVWIEFKRVGEDPTPLQKEMHRILRSRGQDVQVFDDRQTALKYLEKMAATRVPKARR